MSEALKSVAREPLFHFVLLAAGLFVMARVVGPDERVIEISSQEIEWRLLQIEAERGAPLSDEQRRQYESAYIDERILIREAQANGLLADERIDDILVQKMLHVLSGDVIQPTDAELTAYYQDNLGRYSTVPTVTVDEVVLGFDAPLPQSLLDGASPEDLPDGPPRDHRIMERVTRGDLGLLFGDEGARRVFEADPGVWVDASVSVRGRHWLRVRELFPAAPEPLSVVWDIVRLEWIAEVEEGALAERVARLRTFYTILVDGEERAR